MLSKLCQSQRVINYIFLLIVAANMGHTIKSRKEMITLCWDSYNPVNMCSFYLLNVMINDLTIMINGKLCL